MCTADRAPTLSYWKHPRPVHLSSPPARADTKFQPGGGLHAGGGAPQTSS